MSNETVASWVWCGSRLTTTSTELAPACFEKAITCSLSVEWKWMSRNCWSAGLRRRSRFRVVISGAMERPSRLAAAQSRGRSSYFSESRYSSLPSRTGSFSQSS
ncbi:hypothetical protein SLAVM298S_02704 [Streptomyces lavendulae subsp. lavendulae]